MNGAVEVVQRSAITLISIVATAIFVGVPAVAETPSGTAGSVTARVSPSDSASGATCRSYDFPVFAQPGDPTVYNLFGDFCFRAAVTPDTPVQLLIHGGTYDHHYWDWPEQSETYSYVRAATERGYATLNIDQLGNGRSDHPAPLSLNFDGAGYVTHQLVQYLRSGALGPNFTRVILNGHSMGALTAQHEASTFHDVDALIVTGVGHNLDPIGTAASATVFYPAALDPKFANGRVPLGYLTTVNGEREAAFHAPGPYDAAMSATEDRLKDVVSPSQLAGIGLDSYNPAITGNIAAPVLYGLGQFDGLWCTRTRDCNTDPQFAIEKTYYAPGISFTQFVAPRAGHSINLSSSAQWFYQYTFAWLAEQGLAGR